MPPRTSYQPEEPTGRYYGEGGEDEQAQATSDQNTPNVSSDQCSSNWYSDSSSLHRTVVYQGGLMGIEEIVDIPVSKDSIYTSESDDMMVTLSDEASVSSLEDSYVEGDSWSTIDESDEEDCNGSNALMLLRNAYSQVEADQIFIFTDEEISPTYIPQKSNDFQNSIHSKVPGRKFARKIRQRLNVDRQKAQTRNALRGDSFSSWFGSSRSNRHGQNDEYSDSLDDMDQDKSSGSSSAYSDQLLPQNYMIWSRLSNTRNIGLSDSGDSCSCETPGFLSNAVKSMRKQRRRRHSVPATSLLDSTGASSSALVLDNVEIDSVSSWEDDIIPNDSDKRSVEKHVASLRTLLKNKGGIIRNSSRKSAQKNPSHASSAGFTVNSASTYHEQDTNSYKASEEEDCDRSQQNHRGFASKAKRLLKGHRFALLTSSTGPKEPVVTPGSLKGKEPLQENPKTVAESAIDLQDPIPNLEETEWASVYSADVTSPSHFYERQFHHVSQNLDRGTTDQRVIEAISAHQCISKGQTDYDANPHKTNPNLREGCKENEIILKEDCGQVAEHKLAGRNDTMASKENGAHSSSSNLDYVIGWKRVKRKSKTKKKSSVGKYTRGGGERPRLSCIQLNAVSLQSGTAPWSPHLIRSVTPISTTALDARQSSRSIAASLGLGEEADELLNILSASIERQTSRNAGSKEVPKMNFIRVTRDLYIPNFGLYALQSIRYFKHCLSM